MDYLRLEHEYHTPRTWEDYDRAALHFAYTDGQDLEPGREYLFCTDEQTLTHALCNRFDIGSTPSEVAMSLVESYVSRYPLRNYRFGRAFWDTRGYAGGIFSTMREIKEFYPHWRTAFAIDIVKDSLKEMGITDNKAQEEIHDVLDKEMKKVMKISMAFYQAVLQQSAANRPYRSVYKPTTGALQRIGITADKLYAMFFLAGDATFPYHPNRYMIHQSYLTHAFNGGLSQFSREIWENVVTQRVDMEPWFISFGRVLYSVSAMNFYNRDDVDFIEKMKLFRYDDRAKLKEALGIEYDTSKTAHSFVLTQTADFQELNNANFRFGDEVTVVQIDEYYYVVNKARNNYAHTVVRDILSNIDGGYSNVQAKIDLEELWLLTKLASGSPQ